MSRNVDGFINKGTMFIISNKFVLTNILLMLSHIIIAAWFGIMGIYPMMIINIISSLIYVVSTIFTANGYKKVTPYVSFVEIIVQAALAVFYLGWDCGFSQFIIASVPIEIYFMSSSYDSENRRNLIVSIIMTIIDFIVYVTLRNTSTHIVPLYSLQKEILDALFIYSAIWMYGAIILCCFIYTIENRIVTENLRAKNSALQADAQKDPLTGLLNRRGFMPNVKRVFNEGKKFSVAICDIDDFKKVNDTYGHDAGDLILKEITSVIRRETQGFDVCRWGGEEIVILFEGLSLERATHEMEKVRLAVETHDTLFFDKTIKVTITIGVEQHQTGYDSDEAITVADKRLYYGKHHGKNVVINQDFDDEVDTK